MEVGRVRDPEVVRVPGAGLDHEHRHVLGSWEEEKLVTPIGFFLGQPPEIPSDPTRHEEVIFASHDLPLGALREPIDQLERSSVPGGDVVPPEVPGDVEASVEGNEDGGGEGRVVGQAFVLLHPVAEDDVDRELIGGVPAFVGEDAFDVLQGRA